MTSRAFLKLFLALSLTVGGAFAISSAALAATDTCTPAGGSCVTTCNPIDWDPVKKTCSSPNTCSIGSPTKTFSCPDDTSTKSVIPQVCCLAAPSTGANCAANGGTCQIPCDTGSRPSSSSDFVTGDNDCPSDPALKVRQVCCMPVKAGASCVAAGGTCDSGDTCGSGKSSLSGSNDCLSGSICCKAGFSSSSGSGSGGSGSGGSTKPDLSKAKNAAEACTMSSGTCRSKCDGTKEQTTFPCEDSAGNVCCEPIPPSDAGGACGGCTAPASLKDSCASGEFVSFYCSEAKQYCCSPLSAAVLACQAAGGGCKSSCDSKTEDPLQACDGAQKCCVPKKGSSASGSSGSSKPGVSTGFHLQLPGGECMSKGNCTLDDIVNTGANVANFFTTLSAAFFFFSFVYGGARYLLSFGRKDWVTAGTKAMTTSAMGMAIVMLAWMIVNYVANAVQGKV